MIVYKLGALQPRVDKRDYTYAVAATQPTEDLPAEYELDLNIYVRDQSNVNSCVAHVAAEIMEYFDKYVFSVGYIYGTRYEYKGEGMYLRDALKTLNKSGAALNSEFPYNYEVPKCIEEVQKKEGQFTTPPDHKILEYCSIDTESPYMDYNIKTALMKQGPIMVSVPWYEDTDLVSNVLTSTQKTVRGYHCLLIYGWNEIGWKIQNSWGTSWGEGGQAILPYDYKIREAWSLIDDPNDTNIQKTDIHGFKEVLYKILNRIYNLIQNIMRSLHS